MEQQADDNVPTTADIHAQYKTKAPKFEEKISITDTEDLLALCQKRKAFTSEAIEKLPEGQQTFAILADAFRIDVYQARLQLFPEFIVKKRDWIEKVSAPLLGVKKRSIDDYLAEFLNPNMPLDEIGIPLFSQMMLKHVVVFFNDLYWTTRSDNDITKCDCYLSYWGKCKYVNTVQLTKEEWNTQKDYLKAFEQMWFFDNPPRDCTMQDQKPVIVTVQKIDPALQDVAESFDVDIEKPKRKPKKKHKNLQKEKPTRRSQRLKEQDDRLNSSTLSSLHSTTPKPRQTHNSLKSEAELRKAKNLLSNARKSRGKFDIDNFVLKKRKCKRKPVKCSACQQVFSSHKKLTQHVKDDHPEFKYLCHYCPKKFESASWKYQHQARHKGLKFKCSVDSCGKLFQFGYQYRDHQKKHTRKGLYLCSTRDCGRVFTTKQARTFHEKKHSITEKTFICGFKASDDAKPCPKKFESKAYCDQHLNGHFGKKLKTYCGKVYNWPNSRKYHQDKCDQCKTMRDATPYKYKPDG